MCQHVLQIAYTKLYFLSLNDYECGSNIRSCKDEERKMKLSRVLLLYNLSSHIYPSLETIFLCRESGEILYNQSLQAKKDVIKNSLLSIIQSLKHGYHRNMSLKTPFVAS